MTLCRPSILITATGSLAGNKPRGRKRAGLGAVHTRHFPAFAGKLDTHGAATARFKLPASLARQISGTRRSLVGIEISNKQLWSSNAVALHTDP